MKIVWSNRAKTDRAEIIAYIAQDNVASAIAIGDAIMAHVRQLCEFPESGKPGRVKGSRELVVGGTPYLVAYRLRADEIRIMRVVHGRQKWPRKF